GGAATRPHPARALRSHPPTDPPAPRARGGAGHRSGGALRDLAELGVEAHPDPRAGAAGRAAAYGSGALPGAQRRVARRGPRLGRGPPSKVERAPRPAGARIGGRTMNAKTSTSKSEARERITLERTLRAGVEKVWKLWTTKEGLEK